MSEVGREQFFFRFFFMPCYSRSRIWKTKPIRTLLDHENLAKKWIEKTQNANPNLRRRLYGGARDLWWMQAATRVGGDASTRMDVVGGVVEGSGDLQAYKLMRQQR